MSTTNVYRIETSETSEEKSAIAERISGLAPKVIAYSSFINPSPDYDRDDIQQEMALSMIETAVEDPDFTQQSDFYVMRRAVWAARNTVARSRTYDSRTDGETLEFESFPAEQGDPAEIVEHQESMEELVAKIRELSPQNQAVVRMIFLGYDQKEIAEKLGISAPAITQRKKTIAHQIAA